MKLIYINKVKAYFLSVSQPPQNLEFHQMNVSLEIEIHCCSEKSDDKNQDKKYVEISEKSCYRKSYKEIKLIYY